MAEHDSEALRLFEEGYTYDEVADKLGISYKSVNHALDRARKKERDRKKFIQEPVSKRILSILQKKAAPLEELCDKTGRNKSSIRKEIKDLRDQGYDIQEKDEEYFIERDPVEKKDMHTLRWKGNRLKLGFLGDTQLGSKYQQLTYLHETYDIFQAEGIKTAFHTGDLIDGEDIYQGHKYEIHTIGSDAQVDYAKKNYPYREGIETHFITGNHDLCYYKKQGRDIGKSLEKERADLKYLGQIAAYVEIAKDVFLYMLHPDGGGAYAISYKAQKIAASFMGGNKPNLMALGHWHQLEYLFERNIHIIQTACFQGQTPYLKRKALMPKLGAWILEIELDGTSIKRLKQETITYYKELRNDF